MRPRDDWKTTPGQKLTRRRFLGAGASAAALAGLSLTGCGGGSSERDDGEEQAAQGTASPTPEPADDDRAPTPQGEALTPLTVSGFVFSDGQFDPHKTQVGALHGQQAFVYSRLLSYRDQAEAEMEPDLAESMPEQPDNETYVFHLRPDARWHDRSPVEGRRVTADDVRHSLERQIAGDGSFVRRQRWDIIDSIETPSDEEIVITTTEPFAGSLARLADPGAFIVPPEFDRGEAAFGASRQVGSGPFTWIEWDERNFASVARNDDWFRGRPQVAGVTLVEPRDSATVEAMLRVRELDVAFLGAVQADRLMNAIPQLQRQHIGNAMFFGMRFYTPLPPFNDPRFRTALSVAMNRRELVELLFQGAGEPNAWVSWPVTKWALSQSELSDFPGYRLGSGGRDQDIADARALLDAMRSDDIDVPSKLTLHAELTSEEELHLGSRIARHVWEALDIEIQLEWVPINELVERHFAGDAPWIAGPDTGWLDLDDWVYPYFHSTGMQNSFALRDEDLDALIESQRAEFDTDARRETGREIQRALLEINAGVNLVSERVVALSWPYVRDFPLDITDGYQDRFSRCWIDTSDPTYRR